MKSFVGNKSQMNSKEFLKMKLWYIRETVEFLFKTTYCLTESSFSERRLVASGNVAKMQKKKVPHSGIRWNFAPEYKLKYVLNCKPLLCLRRKV